MVQLNQIKNKLHIAVDRQNEILNQTRLLQMEYEQLQEDIETLQMMYMHQANKLNRMNNLKEYM